MWDTRYRPQRFSEVLGQEGSVAILKERLRKGTALDTSYIFTGGSGQGKTTLGRILAKAVLCDRLDLKDPEPCNECDNCKAILDGTSVAFTEEDAASKGTIENIRRIVDELPFALIGAKKRIYLFDEAHRMSAGAQDVLLKPIEEQRLVGMFATTEPEKIRGTIRGRCETYAIRKVPREEVLVRMKMVLAAEKVEAEDDAVLTLIDFCGGHIRDILKGLETVSQMGPITVESIRSHLNLSIVSTYYEILLLIPTDVIKAIALVESACTRVTAEEVMSGLAEAAMNSFRLANRMFTDFVYVDKSMAERVFAQYQQGCVELAEFFTRSRYATQIGLVSDVLTLSKTLSVSGDIHALSMRGPNLLPPTMVLVAGSVGAAPVAAEAPPAYTAPLPTPTLVAAPIVPATPQATLAPTPPPPVAVAAPRVPVGPGMRADGIGDLGKDPYALTELDSKGVKPDLPKPRNGSSPVRQAPNFSDSDARDREIIPPEQWKTEFEKVWRG